jgi:hypothetical protein
MNTKSSIAAFIFGASLLCAPSAFGAKQAITIVGVDPDLTSKTIIISGTNFGDAGTVSLFVPAPTPAAVPLLVTKYTDLEIVATIPDTAAAGLVANPGTYQLSVETSKGSGTFGVAFGATGPAGPEGPAAPSGTSYGSKNDGAQVIGSGTGDIYVELPTPTVIGTEIRANIFIKIVKDGMYLVTGQITWEPNGTGNRILVIRKKVSDVGDFSLAGSTVPAVTGAYYTIQNATVFVRLHENEEIYMIVRQNSGVDLSTSPQHPSAALSVVWQAP